MQHYIGGGGGGGGGLVQKRRNSSAPTMELRLICIKMASWKRNVTPVR